MQNNPYETLRDEMDLQKSSPDGDNMDIDSPTDSTPPGLRRSQRQTKEPERYGRPMSTPKVSPGKRAADEELESPDSGKKSKLNTGEGQSQTPVTQEQQQQPRHNTRGRGGQSGGRGGRNSKAMGFSGDPERAQNAETWWNNNNKDETNKGNEQPKTAQTSQTARQQTPAIKGGTIIYGRHYSKYLRHRRGAPSAEEEKHIAQITDGTRDEVFSKKRFHIVLRAQSNHIITVPLYSKKAGLMTQDPVLLHEYLQVVRTGYNGTVQNPTCNSDVVLQVARIYASWNNFLENDHPVSWAHFLEPHSVDKEETLRVVGELEPDSFDQLMKRFSTYFTSNRLFGQTQMVGNW